MADIFRGLQGGFQTGLQLGQAMRQRRQEDELAQVFAKPTEFQGYTTEQGAQLEAAAKSGLYDIGMKTDESGNFQGYTVTPKASPEMQGLVAPQQVQEYGGQRVAGQFDPAALRGTQMREAAGVLGRYGDSMRAAQLMAQAEEQEFLAKSRPMQLESAGLRLEGDRAEAADRKRMADFQSWLQEDPARGQNFQAVAAKSRELGMSPKQQYEIASSLTGIDEAEFKASQSSIRKLLQGKDLNGALAAHKQSDLITPGSHYEVVRGKNGQVSLNNVDTATGKIIQANIFSGTEAEALGYLNKAAMDPANIVDYTLNLRKTNAAISAQEAATEASRATTALRGEQLTGLRSQKAGSDEAARIREQYMELTPEEQAGAKGQGLLRQFNMANAKAGNTVPLGPVPKAAPELSAPVMKRYEELIKSDRWQRAPSIDAKIKMLEGEGISPAAVGLVSPAAALIDAMRRGPAPAASPRATPAGQQLLGLADVMLPPAPAPAPAAPTTSRERMRGLYLGQ